MSVSVPIYQRILYGSPTISDREEKQVSSPGEEDQSSEPHDSLVIATNPRALPSEMLDSNRHAFSALSIHVSYMYGMSCNKVYFHLNSDNITNIF